MLLINKILKITLVLSVVNQSYSMDGEQNPQNPQGMKRSSQFELSQTENKKPRIEIQGAEEKEEEKEEENQLIRQNLTKKIEVEVYPFLAKKGNRFAQNKLAEMYYSGNGVQKNLRLALHWFWQAEAQGYSSDSGSNMTQVYYELGKYSQNRMHNSQNNSDMMMDAAIWYYTEASKRGHFGAQEDIKTVGKYNPFEYLPEDLIKSIFQKYVEIYDAPNLLVVCKWNHFFVEHNFEKFLMRTNTVLPLNFQFFPDFLFFFPNLLELDLHNLDLYNNTDDDVITDKELAALTKLKKLILGDNDIITVNGISGLTNLETLHLNHIENVVLSGFSNLTDLCFIESEYIADVDLMMLTNLKKLLPHCNVMNISGLTNLTDLDLEYNERVDDNSILFLTNLTKLNVCDNSMITDRGLSVLTNITNLIIGSNENITDDGLSVLTNITDLIIDGNEKITDDGLFRLTNITNLIIGSNENITDDGLFRLTNLTSLNLNNNKIITDDGLSVLTNLTSLNLGYNSRITNEAISKLTNLTKLDR